LKILEIADSGVIAFVRFRRFLRFARFYDFRDPGDLEDVGESTPDDPAPSDSPPEQFDMMFQHVCVC